MPSEATVRLVRRGFGSGGGLPRLAEVQLPGTTKSMRTRVRQCRREVARDMAGTVEAVQGPNGVQQLAVLRERP
jgi:hypothetical protein